jgi:hypothetical protein
MFSSLCERLLQEPPAMKVLDGEALPEHRAVK